MRGAERRAPAEASSHARDAERLREEAVGWFVRLGAEQCSEAERRAFERWLAESEAHRAAYARTESLWRQLDGLHEVAGPDLAAARKRRPRRPIAATTTLIITITSPANRKAGNATLLCASQDHLVAPYTEGEEQQVASMQRSGIEDSIQQSVRLANESVILRANTAISASA